MSKKKNSKVVIFNLTMPKTEIPFARLSTPLKRFGKLREAFEVVGLRVEIVDFRKYVGQPRPYGRGFLIC